MALHHVCAARPPTGPAPGPPAVDRWSRWSEWTRSVLPLGGFNQPTNQPANQPIAWEVTGVPTIGREARANLDQRT